MECAQGDVGPSLLTEQSQSTETEREDAETPDVSKEPRTTEEVASSRTTDAADAPIDALDQQGATGNASKRRNVKKPLRFYDSGDDSVKRAVTVKAKRPRRPSVRSDDSRGIDPKNNVESVGVVLDPNQELEAAFLALKKKRRLDVDSTLDHLSENGTTGSQAAKAHSTSELSLAKSVSVQETLQRQNLPSNEEPRAEARKRSASSSRRRSEQNNLARTTSPREESDSSIQRGTNFTTPERLTSPTGDSVEKRRSRSKSDYVVAPFLQYSGVVRGSVLHKVLEKLGRLVPDCLVDDPFPETEEPEQAKTGDDTKPDAVVDSSTSDEAVDLVQQSGLKVCFRSSVLPQKSRRVPKVNHRVIILQGPHRGQTGYVVDELHGKLFVVESDEVPVGPEQYTQWTVNSAYVMTVATYQEKLQIPRNVSPPRRHLTPPSEPPPSVDMELLLSCLEDNSGT